MPRGKGIYDDEVGDEPKDGRLESLEEAKETPDVTETDRLAGHPPSPASRLRR